MTDIAARFTKKISEGLEQTRNGLHDGLFTAYSDEPNWGIAHRILIPAFGPLSIRNMFDDMHDMATQLAMKLARAGPDYVMDAADDFTRLTLDTIALCSMDFRFNSFYTDKLHPFVAAMAAFLSESSARGSRPAMIAPLYRAKNKKYFEDIEVMRGTANEVIQHRRTHPSDRKDLLNSMLNGVDSKTGGKLDDSCVISNLITFMIAGHETTSGTLTFAFYELLNHAEAYEKAQKEVDDVIGKNPVTVDHLSKLKYLNAILRETLRLHGPVGSLPLTPLEDTVIGDKYAIGKGETVMVILQRLHEDPNVWGDDALEWKPERMVDEKFNALPKNAWRPFGNGARACIGRPFAWQEAVLVLAMLLQNFNFQMDNPSYTLAIKQTGTIKPKDFYMRASLRHGYTATQLEYTLRGYHAAVGPGEVSDVHPTPNPSSDKSKKLMNLFYGSNTGTSEAFAGRLATRANNRVFTTSVKTLDSAKEHLDKDALNVIVASSFEGEPADNACHFVAWLQGLKDEESPLKDVPYIVFGCGHSDWTATYQKIPKLCDAKIEACGGKRIAPRGEANAANGDMFSEFEAWEDDVFWPSIDKNYGGDETASAETADAGLHIEVSHTRASIRSDVSEAKVLSKKLLTSENAQSRKMTIEIQLPTEQDYRTGDYLAVLPTNHKDNVSRVMKYFGLNWDCNLKVSGINSSILREGLSISAQDLFTGYIELTQPATKRNITALIEAATNPETKQTLSSPDFTKDIAETRTSVLDLLEKFPDIHLPLGQFLSMVPPMRLRQYSISSSPVVNPGTCTLTFSILDAPALSGQGIYHGTASNYLSTLEKGDILHVAVKPSSAAFHPPLDVEKTGIIMLAAGTGIAPFRGFVQERAAQIVAGGHRKLAPAVLFYGCRAPDEDDLHADEMAEWERAGAVRIFKSFSKLPKASDGCKYVQDRLWMERELVRQMWRDGGKIYLCGSGALGVAVNRCIGEIYAEGMKSQGVDVGEEEVRLLLERIRRERYAVDVYD